MKKILILTRFRGEYEPTRLKKEAISLGYSVDVVNYEQVRIGVAIGGEAIIDLGTGNKLEDYDLVIPRAASARGKKSLTGIKSVMLEYLSVHGGKTRVVNGKSFRTFPLLGKLEQGVLMSQAGLPSIPFQSFNGKKGWKNFLENDPSLPVMVKMRFGSHGKGVKLAENTEKLIKISEKYNEGTILIQPVLKVRRWYRVIVLGGKVLGMMAHRQKSKFQTTEIKEEVRDVRPEFTSAQFTELENICLRAAALFGCDYAGLDVAWEEDQKRWLIFEINRTAQFKWFEKAHPEINVSRQMVNF